MGSGWFSSYNWWGEGGGGEELTQALIFYIFSKYIHQDRRKYDSSENFENSCFKHDCANTKACFLRMFDSRKRKSQLAILEKNFRKEKEKMGRKEKLSEAIMLAAWSHFTFMKDILQLGAA